MQLTVRPYVTAGIALVGASVIAVTPITPLPETQAARTMASSSAVQLSAMANPIQPWANLVQNTIGNAGELGTAWLSDPAPALRQILSNQFGYAELYANSMVGFVKGMAEWATGDGYGSLPNGLREAADELKTGNIEGAVQALNTSFIMMFLGGPISLMGLLEIPVSISKNITAALEAVNTQVMYLGLGFLQNTLGVTTQIGDSAQAIFDAIRVGDLVGAVSEAIGTPANVLNALINGYDNGFSTMPGLITSGADGSVPGLLTTLFVGLPQAIAAAIAPPAPASRAPLAEVASLPAPAATLVSLETSSPTVVEATVDTPATVTGPEVAPEPSTPAGPEAPADTTAPAEGNTTSTDAGVDTKGTDTTVTPVDTKDGNKVLPGARAGANNRSGDQTQAGLKARGDQVGTAAKNFGGGIKKTVGGNRSASGSNSSSSTGSDTGGGNE